VHDEQVRELIEAWDALISRHTGDPGAHDVGRGLLSAWSQPHRRYHAVAHLRAVLHWVEDLAGYADNADAVRLAAWYHDSVYAGRPDDEELSAQRAEQELSRLGVAPALVDEVARLVRMTVTHDPDPGDRNGEALSDADLSTLALPAERYRHDTAAIRAEYAHVPEEVFRKGRRQVLLGLLEGPGVFRTEAGRRRWEARARANMLAELMTLEG
jgi:predicted metal-dependent HD superfamily phosphohydrolase